ncbi:TIGR00341 family protein [Sulfuricurvum sp.]|uniref:TIGR00341 family protein n=1 Tax=Sulfuricurvum sp. TaxID=2025608 RepID=UPI002639AFFF|nr:TIGR00341 family protein [Sulfuricurvum sp.]MDD2781595.1 TIGR00341 family protein [Sulfuricurvum sp.]
MNELHEHRVWLNLKEIIKDRLSLAEDKAEDDVIDDRVRSEIDMRGTNLWVLIFAVFIASIGLNVNSTAVIIGAMLISPLMGPIMGIGYGAGINDFTLIRRSFLSLVFATFIALLTSTLYFLISPLDTVQSELLARTTPTAWDVLIGLFGGLAGIVALTRKEKSNVIPGVAIATALMPPLCTAGFGLANGNWEFFFGAFYLYTINFVFIALSSFIIIRIFNVAEKKYVDSQRAIKAQRYIIIVTILTLLPSSYLAYRLVGEEVFKANASHFVNESFDFKTTNVAKILIDPKTNEIKVFLIGEHISQEQISEIRSKLSEQRLSKATLIVYQNGENTAVDLSTLKAGIITDLYQNSQAALQSKDQTIAKLQELHNEGIHLRSLFSDVPNELETLFPKVHNVVLSQSYPSDSNQSTLVLNATASKRLSKEEHKKIESWLKMRTKNNAVIIIIR